MTEIVPAIRRGLAIPASRLTRGLLGSGIFAGGLYVYTVVQDVADPQRTLSGAWDAAIPFVPELVLVYFLFFPFVVLAAFAAAPEDWLRILLACVLAAAVGWACFLALPASLSRPDPASAGSPLARELLGWLHRIDDSHNTFPSLHVAVTWIACLAFRHVRAFAPAVVVAVAISSSTLLVKQHTLLDVTGGLFLAGTSLAVAGRVAGGRLGVGPARAQRGPAAG